MASFSRMMRKALQKSRPAPRSSNGNTAGIIRAEAKEEITTKAVIVLILPPIFAVTTGAAVAAGPMIQVSTLSHRIFCQRFPSTQKMIHTLRATSTSWEASTPICQRWGRIWWKSMRQKVENRVLNTIIGKTVSTTAPRVWPAASSWGTQ